MENLNPFKSTIILVS